MSQQIGVINVPTRYEALIDTVGRQQIGNVLIESHEDMNAIKEALVELKSASQGKLMFLLGDTGVGKTTLAESSYIHLANEVSLVITPPPDYAVPLNELPAWLAKNVKHPDNRAIIVNLDSRELPILDENAHLAAMVNLNAYLRRNKNILAVWPVINRDYAIALAEHLKTVGGHSALVRKPIHNVKGIPKERYLDVLLLILNSSGARLDDAAVTNADAESMINDSTSIGDYLRRIHDLVVSRYDIGEVGRKLPRISIVVSSNGDSSEACRMLRRGNKYLADPERLLQFSRANVADDWRRMGQRNSRHSLPFIASLFEVRLLNVTGSTVVNACAFSESTLLKETVRFHYPSPVKANAATTMALSSLMRSLKSEEDVSPTGSSVSTVVSLAYAAIQKLSKANHRAINEALIKVITNQLRFDLPGLKFEHLPHAREELRVDTWFERADRPETLEFTHRQADELSPAVISSYTLSKLMDYARDYGLL